MRRTKIRLAIVPDESRLPEQVETLLPREREIATIVYALRAATAVDVAENLSETLQDASIRSMMNRLVAKGILKRMENAKAFIYLPAISCKESGLLALRRFADDYFDGSLRRAARTMEKLTESYP